MQLPTFADCGTSHSREILKQLGLDVDAGHVQIGDIDVASSGYVHHSRVPVAIAGYAMASPIFARGRFPDATFIDLVLKRPAMDQHEVIAFAAVCGIQVSPPFWGNPGPFAAHLWDVIERYQLSPFFERVDQAHCVDGDHYAMRPRGLDWTTLSPLDPPHGIDQWRAQYRKLSTPTQLMVVTILHLYLQRKDSTWMLRVPKKWHASDAINALREHGMLHDWAKLLALYPGW